VIRALKEQLKCAQQQQQMQSDRIVDSQSELSFITAANMSMNVQCAEPAPEKRGKVKVVKKEKENR
jgi:hypothetical protein